MNRTEERERERDWKVWRPAWPSFIGKESGAGEEEQDGGGGRGQKRGVAITCGGLAGWLAPDDAIIYSTMAASADPLLQPAQPTLAALLAGAVDVYCSA
jgi:hypothetical protein